MVLSIYADDTALYSKCNRTCDLWYQPMLSFERESNLRDIVDRSRKCLFDFDTGRSQIASFDFVLLMWKWLGPYCCKFYCSRVTIFLCKSTIQPYMEYCCHVWVGAPNCDLDMSNKLHTRVYLGLLVPFLLLSLNS